MTVNERERPRLTTLGAFLCHLPNPKGSPIFIPFLAAATVASAFARLGAMTVKIGVLTSSLYAVILIAILLALYAQSLKHRKA